MRIKNWSNMSSETLFGAWCSQFTEEEDAVAHAIWVANRLAKGKAATSRKVFYSLKDHWLSIHQDCLVDGRISRTETAECWKCCGTGRVSASTNLWRYRDEDDWDDCDPDEDFQDDEDNCDDHDMDCIRCGGSGIFRSWQLFEHHLVIAGQRYCFHSYLRPSIVSETPGANCESYGDSFSPDEIGNLSLPFSGMVRVIGFVARDRWRLVFDKRLGKYVRSTALPRSTSLHVV